MIAIKNKIEIRTAPRTADLGLLRRIPFFIKWPRDHARIQSSVPESEPGRALGAPTHRAGTPLRRRPGNFPRGRARRRRLLCEKRADGNLLRRPARAGFFPGSATDEIFGEMAVIERRPRSATASAGRTPGFIFCRAARCSLFIERSPGLAFALLQQVSHRLREFNHLHLREIIRPSASPSSANLRAAIIHA